MNRQEIFNRVKTHLLAQGKRSAAAGYGCAYRGDGGTSCALGCLMTDEAYDRAMLVKRYDGSVGIEGRNIMDCGVRDALRESSIEIEALAVSFFEKLQHIHDTIAPSQWAEELTTFALYYGLQP